MFNTVLLFDTLAAFIIFCAASSAVYVFNDVLDREQDQKHPEKRQRPVASGKVSVRTANAISVIFAAGAVCGGIFLGYKFLLIVVCFLAVNIMYSISLKNIVIIDVFSIALSFILRVVAGGFAAKVHLSPWLFICTTLLALFLGLSKRRHELTLLEDNADEHRNVLGEYTPYLLDQMISVITASTVVAYTLYTLDPGTIVKLGTDKLIFTVPFVLYGILRYLYLVHRHGRGGSPGRVLYTDKPLLFSCCLWIITVTLVLYLK